MLKLAALALALLAAPAFAQPEALCQAQLTNTAQVDFNTANQAQQECDTLVQTTGSDTTACKVTTVRVNGQLRRRATFKNVQTLTALNLGDLFAQVSNLGVLALRELVLQVETNGACQ